jgi:hypothetical protein
VDSTGLPGKPEWGEDIISGLKNPYFLNEQINALRCRNGPMRGQKNNHARFPGRFHPFLILFIKG